MVSPSEPDRTFGGDSTRKKLATDRRLAAGCDYAPRLRVNQENPVIVIHASLLIDPAKADAAIAAAKDMMAESRKEPGCHAYTFARDLYEPGRFHIIEEWESDEALAVHFKTPHMVKFQALAPTFGIKGMTADRFAVSSKAPLR
jgi:quinol monooxygenase YgiN